LRRHLEGARGANHRDQREDRVLADTVARAQQREQQGRATLDELAQADDTAPVVTVCDMTDDEQQRDRRQELREPDQAEVEHASRQRVDLPTDGNRLHLVGEYRRQPRDPEARERRVVEQRSGCRTVQGVR
jgi:hypothetical protein